MAQPTPTGRRGPSIGVFGGTFDPVHVGHLVAALEVRQSLELDRVLLVVANDPWQKSGRGGVTQAEDRFAVVQAATEGLDGLEASRMEIDRGGQSFTADTIAQLAGENPGARLHLVVGDDVAAELDSWKRVEELRQAVVLVIVERGGVAPTADPAGWRIRRVSIPALQISSSDLRRRLRTGGNVHFLIPEAAIRCISERGLYASSR